MALVLVLPILKEGFTLVRFESHLSDQAVKGVLNGSICRHELTDCALIEPASQTRLAITETPGDGLGPFACHARLILALQ